jgi:hypothetical protein
VVVVVAQLAVVVAAAGAGELCQLELRVYCCS